MLQAFCFKRFLLKTTITLAGVGCCFATQGKEGIWLPPHIKNREADMKAMGLEIPVDQIYNKDGSGLNNAVILFGTGCTGAIISSKGLILTNHHCGYGTVQGLSSRENDYFANGFWAMNTSQEIPCPGLKVTFIRQMENVSGLILDGIDDLQSQSGRDSIISARIKTLEKGYRYTTKMDATIKPYFNGNQYWVIVTETFSDVRLVGFPPNGIGDFGGDSDNWMWPRHTGDFSMFRVYAGKDNKAAAYDKANKPYQTTNFFSINVSGYKEGDFTMVYGFPGTTQEYISSYQLNQTYAITDPIRIDVRTKKLDVWTKSMDQSRDVFLKYTSKRRTVANGWKKWQGEIRGLKINDVPAKKRSYEQDFQAWASSDTTLPYASSLLPRILANTTRADSAIKAEEYIKEAVLGIELIQQAATLDNMLNLMRSKRSPALVHDSLQKLAAALDGFYRNYDVVTDKQVFSVLMRLYLKNNQGWSPESYRRMLNEHGQDYDAWADDVYQLSMLTDQGKMRSFAGNATVGDTMQIMADPAWQLYEAIQNYRRQYISPVLLAYYDHMNYLNRLYMKAQMTKDKHRMFYPDANLTLRLSYGKIDGLDPEGAAPYSVQTNLDEVIAKDNPAVEEFRVPQKLKDLHAAKNYGRWAVNGTVPVAFIASNHTSGGNSGSPVMNSKGQLIGLNFDRVWEGTMSDLYFDPNLCRNISLDIRYTLFIIEKFGNAEWLLKEMNIVKK